MNKLIRTIKTAKKAREIQSQGNVTIFTVTSYGLRQDGTLSSNIINDREYQIFEGIFYNYQLSLKPNQKAERLFPINL